MANDLVLRVSLPDEPAGVIASGGQINNYDGYIVHTFTSSATFEINNVDDSNKFEVFMVGGGAGGGSGTFIFPSARTGGGGGGAGGVVWINSGAGFTLSSGSYSVVVGQRGQ